MRSAVAACLLALAPGFLGAQTPPVPRGFEAFRVFLWMHEAPPLDERLPRALAQIGVFGINVDHGEDGSRVAALGIPAYLSHAAGKGIFHLRPPDFEPARDSYARTRDATLLVRRPCLCDPATDAEVDRVIDRSLARAGALPALAFALDDEISMTVGVSPFDSCRCARCLASFREHLRGRFGTDAAAAAALGIAVAALRDFVPPTTDEMRATAFGGPPETWNLAPWATFRDFTDAAFADSVGRAASRIRSLRPGVPVGMEGGAPPSAFGGMDWWRLMKVLDFVEPYDIGGTHALVRSFARPGTVILKTLFPEAEGGRRRSRQDLIHELWEYALRGNRGAILWSAGAFFEARNAARPTPLAADLADTLRDLAGPAVARFLAAPPEPPRVALLHSQAIARTHWMLDSRHDGRTWIRRLNSYEALHASQWRTRVAWQALLEDLAIPHVWVAGEEIRSGARLPDSVTALVLPRAIALSDAEAAFALGFARRGGRLVIDGEAALFDELSRARATPPLDAPAGVEHRSRGSCLRDGRPPAAPDPGRPDLTPLEPGLLAARASRNAGGVPIAIGTSCGSGHIAWLNLAVQHYPDLRRTGAGTGLLAVVAGALTGGADTTPVRVLSGSAPPPAVFLRREGNALLVAIHMNPRPEPDPDRLASLLAAPPTPIRIELGAPRAVTNLVTGESLGRQSTIDSPLDPARPILLRLE